MDLNVIKNNAVSTVVEDDYFIIFNDDTTKRITKEQAEAVMSASGTSQKFFTLNGALYNFSNIARLIPVREYYDQFPDERPAEHAYPKIERPNEEYVGMYHRVMNSEQLLEQALRIWKKQRAEPDFVPVTGGLDRLIKFGEDKLFAMKNDKIKKVEIEVNLQLSKDEPIKKPFYKRTRSDVLSELRARRKQEATDLFIS